jgi:hypothetical protein
MVCSVRWSVPGWRYCPDAFAVTRGGYLERRDAAGREFPVQNRDPDLRHAVRPFVSPAHLSLLGHAVADDLVHRGLGDAADRQALAMPSAVVDQRVRVVPQAPGDGVQVPPQQRVFAENRTRTMNPASAIVVSRVVVPGSVAERALVHRTTVGLPVPQNGSGHDQSHILVSIASRWRDLFFI